MIRAGAVVGAALSGVGFVALANQSSGQREQRVAASDSTTAPRRVLAAPTDVVLSDGGPQVWPSEGSAADRSSAVAVSSAFVASLTGEAPAEAVARQGDGPQFAPTYVDVKLASGATIEVLAAPQGDRSWRILQVGQPPGDSSGGVQADFIVGPVEIGTPSPLMLKFAPPIGAAAGTAYYSTTEGTFAAKLDMEDIEQRQLVLPNTFASGTKTTDTPGPEPMNLVAAALVFRSGDGLVLSIRAGYFGSFAG